MSREAITIVDLSTTDRGGELHVDGSVALEDWRPAGIVARVRADEFPIRSEGMILATVDGEVTVDGRLDTDPRTLDIRMRKMAVKLPEETGRDVQSLEPHPTVIYPGEPGFDRSLTVEEALAAHRAVDEEDRRAAEEAPPLVVTVRSRKPFWVRRSDLAVQLGLDLTIRSEATKTAIRGPVEIERGFIQLIGKTFDLEEGSIEFAGALPVDPALDLAAVHRLPSNETVTVHIEGTLGAPELSFSSSDPSVTSDTDAIALLMGVRGQESQGQADAASEAQAALAGLTAGLIGSLTRRELGQYMPVLSVQTGGTAETTRVRAGFQADKLIPKAWRGFILGMFIEGSVGGGGAEADGGTTAGFLIELLHPHDLTTTATYEQPDNWSLDLLWEP